MHWIVAMFSIVATETSVITFVGIPALSFVDHNWSVLQIVLGFILGRVIVSHFFISMYYKNGIVSIYEVIGQKFGVEWVLHFHVMTVVMHAMSCGSNVNVQSS